jgi:hypothetical protein
MVFAEASPRGARFTPRTTASLGLLLLALGVTLLVLRAHPTNAPGRIDLAPDQTSAVNDRPVANASESVAVTAKRRGAYRFDHPASWSSARVGPTTKILSPAHDTVIAVGHASGGTHAARVRFAAAVRRSYGDVRVETRRWQTINGRRVALISGRAVNASGIEIRWLYLAMPTRDGVIDLAAFADARSDPHVVLPALHTIAASVEPVGRAGSR